MSNSLQRTSNSSIQNYSNNNLSLTELRKLAINPQMYNARVTRMNPCALVIMIDQSGSMSEDFYDTNKAEAVANIVNDLLADLTKKCQRNDGIRDYFHVLVLGYGQEINGEYASIICWEGKLVNKTWVTISELKSGKLREETKEVIERLPFGDRLSTETKHIWINPIADGLTPMKGAFELCYDKLEDWTADRKNSYPPLVVNITDGEPSDVDADEDLLEITNKIKSISTQHGSTLLFNCLLTDAEKGLEFPSNIWEIDTSNDYHRLLFEVSSLLPIKMKKKASEKLGRPELINEMPVGVIINGDAKSLIDLLDIGTSTILDNADNDNK